MGDIAESRGLHAGNEGFKATLSAPNTVREVEFPYEQHDDHERTPCKFGFVSAQNRCRTVEMIDVRGA